MDQSKFYTFCSCFYQTFQIMVTQIPELELSQNSEAEEISGKTLSAIVGVVGLNKGRVHVEMHRDLAQKIYESMNGEPAGDEMDLCFYLAEFTNMITGNGITSLNNTYKGINLRLTPPAIFAGDNLEITTPGVMSDAKIYHTKYGAIRIKIGFEGV